MAFTDPDRASTGGAHFAGVGLGCLFVLVLLFPVVIAASMGDAPHCQPLPDCQPGMSGPLLRAGLLALAPAILLAAAFSALFRWLGRLITAQEGEADTAPRAATPWWAFAAVPLAILAGTWLVWGEPLWQLW